MTNKQIIHGVDISKCPYGYKNNTKCNLYEDDCRKISDCEYKELKRKDQALEKIEGIAKEILKAYDICPHGCDACKSKDILSIINEVKNEK